MRKAVSLYYENTNTFICASRKDTDQLDSNVIRKILTKDNEERQLDRACYRSYYFLDIFDCRAHAFLLLIVLSSKECSGKPVQIRRLTRAFLLACTRPEWM